MSCRPMMGADLVCGGIGKIRAVGIGLMVASCRTFAVATVANDRCLENGKWRMPFPFANSR